MEVKEEEKLKELPRSLDTVLKELKDKFEEEWKSTEEEFMEIVRKIKGIVYNKIDKNQPFDEEDVKKILELSRSAPKNCSFLLRYIAGAGSDPKKVLLNLLNNEHFSEFVNALEDGNIETVKKKYEELKTIKYIKHTTLSTWLAIFRDGLFMPIWGYEDDPGTFSQYLLRDFEELKKFVNWWYQSTDDIFELLDVLRHVANNAGINNMFEAAFYLNKYKNIKPLVDVLKSLKARYSPEWKRYESVTLEIFERMTVLLLKESPPATEISDLIKNIPPEIDEILYYDHSKRGYASAIEKIFADENFKELIKFAKDVDELDANTIEDLKKKINKIDIPEVQAGLSIISTWLSIVNPLLFMPLHGNVPSKDFREMAEKLLGIKLGYGGVWRRHISDYLEFLREINRIKSDLNTGTTFELAYYSSKYKSSSPKTNFWIEIGSPPSKEYIGKFLWAPKAPNWKELEEVKRGDVVYHYITPKGEPKEYREKFMGKSKVKEGPKVIRKDELIEKMKEIDKNWEENFLKNKGFEENWGKYDNFYLVELQDYEEFKQPISKDEIGFKPPQKYFIGANPDLVEKIEEAISTTLDHTPYKYLATRGYLFPDHLVAQFYTALKTKGFVILSGLSGTGKTKIAQEFCSLLGETILLQVRPDWRDSKPLIGWYNPLDGSYSRTPLLDFILKAKEDYDNNRNNSKPYFIILDEMNLAHVEYYFADFLSVLESGRDNDGYTRDSIKLHNVDGLDIPKELRIPPNLYIIGTVNVDETTYTFSPKVLDRAFTIEFHDVDLGKYPPEKPSNENTNNVSVSEIIKDFTNDGKFLGYTKEEINRAVEEFKNETNKKYWNALTNLNKALEPYDLHFGYRIVDEIALFFKNAKESWNREIVEFQNDDEIFDLAILMKILPKFHGNRKKLEKPLLLLLKLAKAKNKETETLNKDIYKKADELFKDVFNLENAQDRIDAVVKELTNPSGAVFPHTAKKVLRMLRQLYEVGFASFS